MPNIRVFQRSFNAGEMSPEMLGQIDDAKFRSGVALCRNFIAKAQGPAENRPGLEFVREVKDSTKKTRLIPFTYSTTQTMVLEVGAGYFRFHTAGATLVYATTWATGTAYAIGDRVVNTGVLYTCATAHTSGTFATDLGAGKWTSSAWLTGTAYTAGAIVSQAGTNYQCVTAHTSGTFATDYLAGLWRALISTSPFIYEVVNTYAEADLFDIHYVQSADVLTLVHPGYAPRELRRYGATYWVLSTISFAAAISAPTGVTATKTGSGTAYTYHYVVTAIAADGISESAASTDASETANLYTTGEIITITWGAVTGASRYRVYKMQGGVYGYIGETATTALIDDNIAPDLSMCPPVYDTTLASGAGSYPSAVSYYEQRRCFAGTTNAPQQIWMTKSGTESNLSYALPIRDDDRISFRVAAREANSIRHIVPLSQLLLMTSAAEWRVTSVNSDAITPTSISVCPQSYVGASNVQPVIINNNLIYGAARGGHIRECAYNWQANGFATGDLSLRATHLFDSYDITDMAFSKAPHPLVWFVSSSGDLLGLTYIPEQQVGAWHQHDTINGVFESCAVVAEGQEDVLYVVVKRLINGSYVRYIERLASRMFVDQEDAFFVDSGLSYDGTNTGSTTMTITGGTLWDASEELTLTASASMFTFPGSTDVGDAVIITDANDVEYTLTISSTTSATEAKVRTDKTIPVALRSAATTTWAFARNSFSGLSHLEGATVSILGDGAVHPQEVVASGAITLDRPVVVAHIGLPITADLQTLPVAMQIDSGFGQGRFKNVNKAWLRVYRSSGVWVGPDEDHLVEAKQRTTEPYGSPPALKSEEIPVMVTPSWADSGQVFIRQEDPLPLTIVSLTFEVAIGG
jgi:hypothetical protein